MIIYSLFYKYGNKKELILRGGELEAIYTELRKYAKQALNNNHEVYFIKHGFNLSEYGTTGYYITAKKYER